MNRVADADTEAGSIFGRQLTQPLFDQQWQADLICRMPDAVLLEYQGTIIYANAAALHLFDAADLAAFQTCRLSDLAPEAIRESVASPVSTMLHAEADVPVEEDACTMTGRRIRIEATRMLVPFRGESAVCMVARDITDRSCLIRRLRHDATHDPLTGLANRRRFTERLESAAAIRQTDRHLALAFIDLDRFKEVNDQYGHRTGDLVLQSVADTLMACVRRTDLVARLGGDEFVLLLSDYVSEAEIQGVLQRILDSVSRPRNILDVELTVACSIGYSLLPGSSERLDQTLYLSDAAMFRAKQAGGNCVRKFGIGSCAPKHLL